MIEPHLDLPTAYMTRIADCRNLVTSLMIEKGMEVPPLQIEG